MRSFETLFFATLSLALAARLPAQAVQTVVDQHGKVVTGVAVGSAAWGGGGGGGGGFGSLHTVLGPNGQLTTFIGGGGGTLLPMPRKASPIRSEPPDPLSLPLKLNDYTGLPLVDLEGLAEASDPSDRYSAAFALGKLKPPRRERAVRALMKELNDSDLRVVSGAARALGEQRATEAVGPLIELLNQSDPGLLANVAAALGDIGDPQAKQPLESLAGAVEGNPHAAALSALAKLRR